MNLNKSNGIIMAVLGMSVGFTRIWWKAITIYTFEKILAQCKFWVKSCTCGMGDIYQGMLSY